MIYSRQMPGPIKQEGPPPFGSGPSPQTGFPILLLDVDAAPAGCVHATPARCVHAAPTRCVRSTPAGCIHATPARCVRPASARCIYTTSARCVRPAPAGCVHAAPARCVHAAPARCVHAAPARCVHAAPAGCVHAAPAGCVDAAPARCIHAGHDSRTLRQSLGALCILSFLNRLTHFLLGHFKSPSFLIALFEWATYQTRAHHAPNTRAFRLLPAGQQRKHLAAAGGNHTLFPGKRQR